MRFAAVCTITCCLIASAWGGTVVAPPKDAAELYKRAGPAVVTVETDKTIGTGFAMSSGFCVATCYHVVKGASWIRVNGLLAKLQGSDPDKDIAILIPGDYMENYLEFASGPPPRPGTQIYVIGNALGVLERSISDGLVSGIRRKGANTVLQITAPISEGCSGGPVLSADGRVVGMVSAFLKEGQNINIAILAADIEALAKKSRQGTSTTPGISIPEIYNPNTGETKNGEPVIGTMALILKATAIYESPSRESKKLAPLKRHQHVVTSGQSTNGWFLVVGVHGGYVPAEDLAVLSDKMVGTFPDRIRIDAPPCRLAAIQAYDCEGVKYRNGGRSPETGFDAAGLLSYLWRWAGMSLPSSIEAQAAHGQKVKSLDDLQVGDRLYFGSDESHKVTDGGIYVGRGRFLHCVPSKGVVEEFIKDPKWIKRFIVGRR